MDRLSLCIVVFFLLVLYYIFRRPISIEIGDNTPEKRWARRRERSIVIR